jgi:phage terminase large subunit
MKKLMLEEEYEQEMECSFEASARGAFYSKEMSQAEREHRVRPLEANRDMPLHFIFDLGFRDDTATICWQDALDGYPIIHAEADNLRPIRHYIKRIEEICAQYDVKRGDVWLPHDAKAKTLQTGRSIVEQFLAAGIRPRLVPMLDVLDGIAAARMLFPEVWFNAEEEAVSGPCAELVEALKTYRREWDEDTKSFKNQPIHDWSSHYADSFRYFGVVAQKEQPRHATINPNYEISPETGLLIPKQLVHYPFSLDDLYTEANHGRRDGIK